LSSHLFHARRNTEILLGGHPGLLFLRRSETAVFTWSKLSVGFTRLKIAAWPQQVSLFNDLDRLLEQDMVAHGVSVGIEYREPGPGGRVIQTDPELIWAWR